MGRIKRNRLLAFLYIGGPQPAVLQEVNIPIWSNTDCRLKYGPAAPGGIVEHMLCAGQASRDSCSVSNFLQLIQQHQTLSLTPTKTSFQTRVKLRNVFIRGVTTSRFI